MGCGCARAYSKVRQSKQAPVVGAHVRILGKGLRSLDPGTIERHFQVEETRVFPHLTAADRATLRMQHDVIRRALKEGRSETELRSLIDQHETAERVVYDRIERGVYELK